MTAKPTKKVSRQPENVGINKKSAETDRLIVSHQFVNDAAAYIRFVYARSEGNANNQILVTLIHDIIGLADRHPCFLPRVTGYAAKEAR